MTENLRRIYRALSGTSNPSVVNAIYSVSFTYSRSENRENCLTTVMTENLRRIYRALSGTSAPSTAITLSTHHRCCNTVWQCRFNPKIGPRANAVWSEGAHKFVFCAEEVRPRLGSFTLSLSLSLSLSLFLSRTSPRPQNRALALNVVDQTFHIRFFIKPHPESFLHL